MDEPQLPAGLRARLRALYPGARVLSVRALGDDETAGEHLKQLGYGRPLRVALDSAEGPRQLVFHTARADDFGHDRRADRVGNLLLAYDTFGRIPHHAPAVDMGLIANSGADGAAAGELVSLAGTGEPYLLTAWAEGTLYADDLRRIARTGAVDALDLARVTALAEVLLEIHAAPGSAPRAYTRAVRDLLGHGEGIFGLVDSYPEGTPGAPPDRLRGLEEACLAWRWRLRGRHDRLRRIHGDFHPFNLVFDQGAGPTLLDASRGCEGDPADDVACLAINFLFFGLGQQASWTTGLGALWRRFWEVYLGSAGPGVLDAVAPFLAWRGLVLASPRWYPHLGAAERGVILGLVERALAADTFDPAWGAEAMA